MTTRHGFGGVLGRPLDTFFWAHNFMVMALGSCVKWPFYINQLGRTWREYPRCGGCGVVHLTIVGVIVMWDFGVCLSGIVIHCA